MTENANPNEATPGSEPAAPPQAESTSVLPQAGSPADDQKTQQIRPVQSGWAPPGSPYQPHQPGQQQPGPYQQGPYQQGPPQHPYPGPGQAQPTGAYPPQPGYAPTGPYPGAPAPTSQVNAGSGPVPAPPQQHGAPAEPTAEPTPAKSKKKLLAIVGGVLVLIIAVVAITGFWKPGFFWTRTLDVNSVQAGVLQILTDPSSGYGASNVNNVLCNGGQNPVVKTGHTFDCTAKVGGVDRTVTVTFLDNAGTYGVGAPQ